LANISLSRINNNTFQFGVGSTVRIGQNVMFELNGDMDISSGQFVLDGRLNLFQMRGLGGVRKFVFTSELDKRFDLKRGALSLQNIELEGIEHIEGGSRSSIVLAGNATVVLNSDLSLNLDIEGKNNELLIVQDALELSGGIAFFGNASSNILSIRFSLIEPPTGFAGRRSGVRKGWPVLIFSGDTGVFLTADDGLGVEPNRNLAGLIFQDERVAIRNKNENAFIVENNSFLTVNQFHILDFPIKQQSAQFVLSSTNIFGEGIDTSFVRAKRSLRRQIERKTTFSQIRALEREALREKRLKSFKKSSKKRKLKKKRKNVFKDKKHMLTRGLNLFDQDSENFGAIARRNFHITQPEIYDLTYQNVLEISDPEGNLAFEGGASSRFVINSMGSQPFDILATNAHIFLPSDARIGFQNGLGVIPDQIFRFEGKGNLVKLNGLFEFSSENFDLQDSVIFDKSFSGIENPLVRIRDNSIVPLNASTYFGSQVPVELGDQVEFALSDGGSSVTIPTLNFYNGGLLRPASGAQQIYLTGSGQVFWERGLLHGINGDIYLTPNETDNLYCEFNEGEIKVESGRTIATGLGTISWNMHRSKLIIETGGTFAFNDVSAPAIRSTFGSQLRRGNVEQLIIDTDSSVYVGGRLVLGKNTVKNQNTRIERLFYCKWEPLNISGNGLIEYVEVQPADPALYKGFVAQLQTPAVEAIDDPEMTFEKLAIILTQKTTEFTVDGVLHYEDGNGNEFVRTSKGVIIPLQPGDRPIRTQAGQRNELLIIIKDATGKCRAYNDNGVLVD